MNYTVQQLAKLGGITVRALHHYDEIGLLTPHINPSNGYRQYTKDDALKLQQILFFKELEFPLREIKEMMMSSHFKKEQALKDQKELLLLKQERIGKLLETITETIEKGGENMTDDQKLQGFSLQQMEEYKEEAKKRWGNTDAWKQSQERTKHWTKADYERIAKEGEKWTEQLADLMRSGKAVDSEEVQKMVDEHYTGLRTFYEPNLELYAGLGQMYVDDPRFTAYYDKHEKGLAVFMRDALNVYIKNRSL